MRSTKGLVRFTALSAALLYLAVVLLPVFPMMALVWMAAVVLGCCLCVMMSELRTLLLARAGPVVPDKAFDNATSMTRSHSVVGARNSAGFRLRRSTHKYDTTGTMTAHFTSGMLMNKLARHVARKNSKYPAAASSWLGRIIPRKSQCNLYAFNANDQCGFACGAAA